MENRDAASDGPAVSQRSPVASGGVASLHRRHHSRRRRSARVRHGRGDRRLRQRWRSRSARHVLRPGNALPQQRQRHVHRRDEGAGVGDALWSTSAAFVDYDRDGDLDLFVANYLDFTVAGNKLATTRVGARDYCSPRAYAGSRPALPQRGGGRFTDVTEPAGITRADGAGLGVSMRRLQRRRLAGSLVANDATPNQLWINQQNGRSWTRAVVGHGAERRWHPEGSMGIASGDFDADGDEDLFVTNIVGETFALYVNDGRGVRRTGEGGTRGADCRVHRLWHRLVRLRQRRLARSPRRERRRQHHRGAARREVPVSDEQSAVP